MTMASEIRVREDANSHSAFQGSGFEAQQLLNAPGFYLKVSLPGIIAGGEGLNLQGCPFSLVHCPHFKIVIC
jgi:hypothetical protein